MIMACFIAVIAVLIPLPGIEDRIVPAQIRKSVKLRKRQILRIRAGPYELGSKSGQVDPLDVAADVELFAACLTAGLSIKDAAAIVSRVCSPLHVDVWSQAAALLAIGVSVENAFELMSGIAGLDELANMATVSQRSGSALSQVSQQIAQKLRASAIDYRTSAAERAGVLIALPLATCFLPAFIIIGLVPVVLSLGMNILDLH